jgi:pyruvate/2-oxoglutarate dehydrogenase complex dihydrolipoamide acyltransferase (E2) component
VTQPLRDIRLGLPVAGRIEAVLVREGQRVRKGELLLHLDREDRNISRCCVGSSAPPGPVSPAGGVRTKEKLLIEQIASLRPLLATGAGSRKQLEDEELALGAVVAEYRTLEFGKRHGGAPSNWTWRSRPTNAGTCARRSTAW